MFRSLVNGAYIRVVNYHNTRQADAVRFEREAASFRRHFVPVRLPGLVLRPRFFPRRTSG